jgi:hypothetical protein
MTFEKRKSLGTKPSGQNTSFHIVNQTQKRDKTFNVRVSLIKAYFISSKQTQMRSEALKC